MQISNQRLTLDEARTLLASRQRNTTRIFKGLDSRYVARVTYYWYRYIVAVERGGKLQGTGEVAACIRHAADTLTGDSHKWGLMLMGGVGTGKTVLTRALQKAVITLACRHLLPHEAGLRIIHAKDIHKAEGGSKAYATLCDEPMLAIDDLGDEPSEEMSYGTVTTPIADLLEYRYERQLLTIITTNISAQKIRQKYGERIADRCREMFEKILFKNQSYR